MSLASPTATTLAGQLIVYVVCPLLVALVIGLVTYLLKMSTKLNDHGTALALILSQVNPPNAPTLRDAVEKVRLDVAVLATSVTAASNAAASAATTAAAAALAAQRREN